MVDLPSALKLMKVFGAHMVYDAEYALIRPDRPRQRLLAVRHPPRSQEPQRAGRRLRGMRLLHHGVGIAPAETLAADATIVPAAAIAVGFCIAMAVLACTAAYLLLGVPRR